MPDKLFPVIEVFGPTIQGEGAMAGKPTQFVRFGLCDYRCAWCDSGYAVLPQLVNKTADRLTTQDILERIIKLPVGPEWVTLSGGNPAMHQLDDLVDALQFDGRKVAIETQGSIWKDWLAKVDLLTVSPKPPSSEMHLKSADLLPGFMTKVYENFSFMGRVCLKVPVFDAEDYEWAMAYHEAYPYTPFYFSVVTLMGGLDGGFYGGKIDTRDSLLNRYKWLAERVAGDPRARDTTALPQLHALLWGHGRGF